MGWISNIGSNTCNPYTKIEPAYPDLCRNKTKAMERLRIYGLWIGSMLCLLTSCSKAQEGSTGQGDLLTDQKVLIVYLSRTNNTKAVAEIIHEKVGGDLVALELVTPYPEHYQTTVDQVADENATGYLPPLKTTVDTIEKYDVVFIGFPTWGMQLPPPMKSFLNQYDLGGKTVVPFNTNGGYGIGSSFETVKRLCPDSNVLEGFSTKGGSERDGILYVMEGGKEKQVRDEVHGWLTEIGFVE